MDERSDQILEDIETQRNQLGANLNELETRVRRTADWRTHFDNNPMLMLAGALGGGILLGAMVSGSRSRSASSSYTSSRHFSSSGTGVNTGSATYIQKQRTSETIDNIKAGLIAFATAKAKEFLNQALPGFDNYVRDAESNRPSSQFSSSGEYYQGPSYGSGSYNTEGYNTGGYNTGGYGQQTSGQGQGANYGQNERTDYASHGARQRNYSTEQNYGN
jgi:hypothetical protein